MIQFAGAADDGLARNVKTEQTSATFHVSSQEVQLSHASMLKARRQKQKNKKLLDGAVKRANRLEKQALAGPVVKKEKVKKEKVATEKVKIEKVKKVKLTKEELGKQEAKKAKADAGKKGAD
jgi:hypothetical protein